MTTTSSTSTFNDAYTHWMMGPGRAYDFFAPRAGAMPSLLSAVIERPGGHMSGTPTDAAAPLVTPTLWSGLARPKFLPCILSGATADTYDAPGLETLWAHAAQIGAGAHSPAGGLVPAVAAERPRVKIGHPVAQDAVAAGALASPNIAADPAVDTSKPIVVLGIIDDGIAFAHSDLLGPGGKTRIDSVWVQGAPSPANPTCGFGAEITGSQIDALRTQFGGDEDQVYRAAGIMGGGPRDPSPLTMATCHGAHVLDLATGGLSDAQVRIVAVDLPPAATWDTSGFGKDMLMLAAMHHIFDRADRIAAAYGVPALPVVVNMSYGYSGGSHDGTAMVEAALDELVSARRAAAPTALILPSGNSFLGAGHARIDLAAGASAALPWRVHPNDRTSTFAELWLPAGADITDLTVALHAPGDTFGPAGPTLATLDLGHSDLPPAPGTRLSSVPVTSRGATVGALSADCSRGGRWRVLIALAPTEATDLAVAPAGLYTLAITDTRASGATHLLTAYIQRDVSYGTANSGARQSYFDEPANVVLDPDGALAQDDTPGAMTRRRGALSGLATTPCALVVGAAQRDPLGAAIFSGASDGADPQQVDIAAFVDANSVTPGRRASGTRSGSVAILRGTSVAAPLVARTLVEQFRTTSPADLTAAAADNYASLVAAAPGLTTITLEADRVGKGVIAG